MITLLGSNLDRKEAKKPIQGKVAAWEATYQSTWGRDNVKSG